MRLAALQCGKALPYRETLDMFGGYASADKRRHSLESDIDSPVRHSLTALGAAEPQKGNVPRSVVFSVKAAAARTAWPRAPDAAACAR